MRAIRIACLVLLCMLSADMLTQTYPEQPYPQAEISNGVLHAKLYLPDAEKGFYRGMRFDWAGVISSLEYKGHEYYGPFFEKFDPAVEDVTIGNPVVAGVNSATSGPVEEFIGKDGAALGFAEARPGETFCKIGVGALRKPDDKPYSSYRIYTIVDGGRRTVNRGADWIEFTQELTCGAGYAFKYTKTIRLAKGEPVMTIEHTLVNDGKRAIQTQVYDHNFMRIDHQPIGPDVVLTFPFTPRATQDLKGIAEVRGKQIVFPKPLTGGDTVDSDLTGFGKDTSDYDIRVENQKTGAGVRIRGDHPLASFWFWAVRTVVAPEPFIDIKVPQGQEYRWTYTYTFFASPSR